MTNAIATNWPTPPSNRGKMTPAVKAKMESRPGAETPTIIELRLYPYVVHTLMNSKRFEFTKVNDDDMNVIYAWCDNNDVQYVDLHRGEFSLIVTEDFLRHMFEVIMLSYIYND